MQPVPIIWPSVVTSRPQPTRAVYRRRLMAGGGVGAGAVNLGPCFAETQATAGPAWESGPLRLVRSFETGRLSVVPWFGEDLSDRFWRLDLEGHALAGARVVEGEGGGGEEQGRDGLGVGAVEAVADDRRL